MKKLKCKKRDVNNHTEEHQQASSDTVIVNQPIVKKTSKPTSESEGRTLYLEGSFATRQARITRIIDRKANKTQWCPKGMPTVGSFV